MSSIVRNSDDDPLVIAIQQPRIAIESVSPVVEEGAYPAKTESDRDLRLAARIFADGHEVLGAEVVWRRVGKPRSGARRCCPKATISGARSCARRPAAACTSVSRPGSTVLPATAANCVPSMAHACRWTWSCARATNCCSAAPSAAVRRSPPPVRRWPNACRPARASRSGWRCGWRRRPANCCVWSARASTWCAAANTRWRWSDRWRASPVGTSCFLARKAATRHATVPSTT